MDKIVYLLPLVGCAAMMGAMMWMMRGSRAGHGGRGGYADSERPHAGVQEELAALRAEVAALRDRQEAGSAAPGRIGGS